MTSSASQRGAAQVRKISPSAHTRPTITGLAIGTGFSKGATMACQRMVGTGISCRGIANRTRGERRAFSDKPGGPDSPFYPAFPFGRLLYRSFVVDPLRQRDVCRRKIHMPRGKGQVQG